jgi:hypothetical protein
MTTILGLGILGTIFAAQANAGCTNLPQLKVSPPWQPQPSGLAQPRPISAAFFQVSDGDSDDASIVGLWKFEFTAKGNAGGPPDGTPIDAGYVTWHRDGTELMNSGRAPNTGSFCMGVWEQTGPLTFRLNHFALAWDSTGTVFVGPANIRETVTVNRSGNSYAETFSLVQFATDEKTVLAHVVGTVGGTRITAD